MDFVSDQNPIPLYRADREVGFPDYVKVAAVLLPEHVASLSSGAFADFHNREFPIHTKEATWLSAAYFYGDGRSNPKVEKALLRGAAFHGIEDDFKKLAAMAATVKEASAPAAPEFALSVDFGGTAGRGLEHFYPVSSADDVIESSRIMLKDADARRIPVDYARDAAVAIVKAAAVHSVSLDSLHSRVVALGTERMPDFDHALAVADARGWAGVGPSGIELYRDIVKEAAAAPEQINDYLELWLDLDTTHGVKYSSTVLDPYQAFYAGETEESLKKLASEVVVLGEAMIPKTAFSTLAEAAVRKVFSKAAAEKVIDLQKRACANPAGVSRELAAFSEVDQRTLLQALLAA